MASPPPDDRIADFLYHSRRVLERSRRVAESGAATCRHLEEYLKALASGDFTFEEMPRSGAGAALHK